MPEEPKKGKREDFEEHLGFGWGKLFIIICFIQGISALGFSIFDIHTPYLPNRVVGFIIGVLGLSCGYGLMQRKSSGLYLVYAVLAGDFVMGVSRLMAGQGRAGAGGPWLRYEHGSRNPLGHLFYQ